MIDILEERHNILHLLVFLWICSGTCRQKSLWFLPSKSATQETVFTQTRANYRSIDLRQFRSLGQIRRFCRDLRPVSQLPKKPTDTSLRRSISDRETRQQVYCTTSVRIGYILINYVVRYTLVFVKINPHLITSTGDPDVIF